MPDPVRIAWVRGLDDVEIAEIVRQNLPGPLTGSAPAWNRLWAILAADGDLHGFVCNLLDWWASDARAAANGQDADDDAQARRITKFLETIEQARNRLDRLRTEPLAWAGAAASGFNPAARAVLEELVTAINEHRAETRRAGTVTEADEELWDVLARTQLDPHDHVNTTSTAT